MASNERTSGGIGKYLVTYVCILAIAGLQFVIAYQNINTGQMLTRMLILAFVEAALGVLFFMHLWDEKRGLLWFVVIFTLSVLAGLPYNPGDRYLRAAGGPPAAP